MQLAPVETIRRILKETKTIAVVGLSPKPSRPSHRVALYLQQAGYRIIPVNPGQEEILGQRCYPDLLSIPDKVDLVDIFRRPEDVFPIVEQAIEIGARTVWMQQGVVNQEAATLAEEAGLTVIMDRCLKIDHNQFGVS
ncbi:CoA-binding protein [Desulfolithobacter dissulfuricans]|uniref:CoA-binding protein n=2 Tax=Desulfolithobacter dissulfuricans TaxID=2795293 RepID=A0A915U2X5_9BACT|nr:CoA-binding protein [Desulfolithobacter dissulfuricans]